MLDGIQRKFEEAFDIPFVSDCGINGRDIWYEIRPKEHIKELFTLKIRFLNDVRLVMELSPDEYSRPFIADMGNASQDQKNIFLSYAKMFLDRKARVSFSINRLPAETTSFTDWPKHWEHLSLRISRSPVATGEINHEEIILDWGIAMMGMILALANIIPLKEPDNATMTSRTEGNAKKTFVTRYERNPVNRTLCLAIKGCSCSVCEMNFKETYGLLGAGFIHVHHAVPVSQMGEDYKVDPEKELFPVCPNCHAMLHRVDPPMTIADLREIYRQNTSRTSDYVLNV